MKKQMMLCSGLLLSFAAAPAMAGGFVRAEVGKANVHVDASGFGDDSDNDTSYSLRGGYYFEKNFAVEGFYSSFYDKSASVDDGAGGTIDANLKLSGIGLGIVGKTHFGAGDDKGFYLSGRAGFMRGKVQASVTGLGSDSASSTKPYFGVGLGYDFSPKFGLGLNWDEQKGSGDGLSITARTLAVGLEARF
jgi:OOP family OmpA-OmpF porin